MLLLFLVEYFMKAFALRLIRILEHEKTVLGIFHIWTLLDAQFWF